MTLTTFTNISIAWLLGGEQGNRDAKQYTLVGEIKWVKENKYRTAVH